MATQPTLALREPLDDLALAVIRSSNKRLLLLGSEETVVPVRQTFCLAFLDTQNVAGQPLMASRKRYGDAAAGVAPLGKVVPPRVAR